MTKGTSHVDIGSVGLRATRVRLLARRQRRSAVRISALMPKASRETAVTKESHARPRQRPARVRLSVLPVSELAPPDPLAPARGSRSIGLGTAGPGLVCEDELGTPGWQQSVVHRVPLASKVEFQSVGASPQAGETGDRRTPNRAREWPHTPRPRPSAKKKTIRSPGRSIPDAQPSRSVGFQLPPRLRTEAPLPGLQYRGRSAAGRTQRPEYRNRRPARFPARAQPAAPAGPLP